MTTGKKKEIVIKWGKYQLPGGGRVELGEKIRLMRLEAGLSQRQLCGDVITRNMLSQIEHGTAKPSMKTLCYLSEQLGKPVSFFLEEGQDTDTLASVTKLRQAEAALAEGRDRLALSLLAQVSEGHLQRQKLLLQARIPGADQETICAQLPSLDEELQLRAAVALSQGKWGRCLHLLESVEERTDSWYLLRGRLSMAEKQYQQAAEYLRRAGEGEEVFCLLEQCYRELEDYKQAYFYAVKQKK